MKNLLSLDLELDVEKPSNYFSVCKNRGRLGNRGADSAAGGCVISEEGILIFAARWKEIKSSGDPEAVRDFVDRKQLDERKRGRGFKRFSNKVKERIGSLCCSARFGSTVERMKRDPRWARVGKRW